MDGSCVFCRIAAGTLPARVMRRNERILALEDLHPQAPSHVLVLPAEHYATLGAMLAAGRGALAAELLETAERLGSELGGSGGFRLVVNTGPDGGQTVEHVHLHVLAGRPMTWPPG